MTPDQKLEQFAARELARCMDSTIIEDADGALMAFGAYYLAPRPDGMHVWTLSEDHVGCFSSKRSAMAWCAANRQNHINLAISIRNLDVKKQSLTNQLVYYRHLIEKLPDNSLRDTAESKLSALETQYWSIQRELEKCLNSAKYLQIKGFQNETARASYH